MYRTARRANNFTQASFLLLLFFSCLFISCVTTNQEINVNRNLGLSLKENIKPLVRQPFTDKIFRFDAVNDLSSAIRSLGKPNKTIEKEIPNKFVPGTVDKGVTLEYDSFVVRYYFASSKQVYFPYSIEFSSNEKLDPSLKVIGLSVEAFMAKIYPQKADVTRKGQLTFISGDGADQISFVLDGNEKIVGIVFYPYLD